MTADGMLDGDGMRVLERDRLRSLVEPDLELADRLHADDYELIPPGGGRRTKADYLGGIESGDLRYFVFEPASEIALIELGAGFAVRYQALIDIRFPGGAEAGTYWHTDVWRRRGGRWQALWSQATQTPARS